MNEDDIYRASSQYRLWSFSPEILAANRQNVHNLAIERARQNRHAADTLTHEENGEHLTITEELRLIQRYCTQLRLTCSHFSFPISLTCTAVQFLKRFYLTHSPHTYPPKDIYKTVLFLACKSEGNHITLTDYARRISSEPETILAAEYKVMQGLRFTLDVRQPYRGLKGVYMEMLNLAEGKIGEVEGVHEHGAQALQTQLQSLGPPRHADKTRWKPSQGDKHAQSISRINDAYAAAKFLLDAPALLTDVFFLYTPSQIMLAALHASDEPLTSFYLSTKLSVDAPQGPKILATITECASILAGFQESDVLSKEERAELDEKLERCRDPATKDMVAAFRASKMGGGDSDDEEKAERKKAKREKTRKESEDLFGPSLKG